MGFRQDNHHPDYSDTSSEGTWQSDDNDNHYDPDVGADLHDRESDREPSDEVPAVVRVALAAPVSWAVYLY